MNFAKYIAVLLALAISVGLSVRISMREHRVLCIPRASVPTMKYRPDTQQLARHPGEVRGARILGKIAQNHAHSVR